MAAERGHDVAGVVRHGTAYHPPEGVSLRLGSALDSSVVTKAALDGEVIISCIGAQRANPRNPWSPLRPPGRVAGTCALALLHGIGTQSLGLSLSGHTVIGTDISEAAVALAQREAEQRGLSAEYRVWDVRDLADLPEGPLDVVLSGDNSLPHLADDEDLPYRLEPPPVAFFLQQGHDERPKAIPGDFRVAIFGGSESA
jgi:hypothetical protein